MVSWPGCGAVEQGRKLDAVVCQVAASQVPDKVAASVLDAWGLPPTRGGGGSLPLAGHTVGHIYLYTKLLENKSDGDNSGWTPKLYIWWECGYFLLEKLYILVRKLLVN